MPTARITKEMLQAVAGRTVEDVLGAGCRLLFCGINPGLYTAAVGHHFARPGNRFWRVLALSGLTPRELAPAEERELIPLGMGITNLVARASATAAELSTAELRAGAAALAEKVAAHRVGALAVLGAGAWRQAFDSKATIGRQDDPVGGAVCYVLPNPSGLQARYQLAEMVQLFSPLRQYVAASAPG